MTPLCYLFQAINIDQPFIADYLLSYLVRRFPCLIPYSSTGKNEDINERWKSLGRKTDKNNVFESLTDYFKSVEKYSFLYFCMLTI